VNKRDILKILSYYYLHLLIDRALHSFRWSNRDSAPRSRRQIAVLAPLAEAMTSQALAQLLRPSASRRVLHHRRRPTLSSSAFPFHAAPYPRYVLGFVNTRWHDHVLSSKSHSRVLAPPPTALVTVCSYRKQRPNRHV